MDKKVYNQDNVQMPPPGAAWTIDRFEGDYAVCEDEAGALHDIPRAALPAAAREGDVLRAQEDGVLTVDGGETKKRKQAARALFESLIEK